MPRGRKKTVNLSYEQRIEEIEGKIEAHKNAISDLKKELKRFRIVATIHKDVTERLEKINASLAAETRKVLDINKSERHIRGGLATREKYLHQHA